MTGKKLQVMIMKKNKIGQLVSKKELANLVILNSSPHIDIMKLKRAHL